MVRTFYIGNLWYVNRIVPAIFMPGSRRAFSCGECMTFIELMEFARDKGFQGRIQMAMFNVARDKSGSADTDDTAFVAAIIKGTASVFQMA